MCNCTGEALTLDRCPDGKPSPVDNLLGIGQVAPLGYWPLQPQSPPSFHPWTVDPGSIKIIKNPDGTDTVRWEGFE